MKYLLPLFLLFSSCTNEAELLKARWMMCRELCKDAGGFSTGWKFEEGRVTCTCAEKELVNRDET